MAATMRRGERKPTGAGAFFVQMRASLRWILHAALMTAGGLLTGCGVGALHQATLVGQCVADDPACSRRHPQGPIAIGSRFFPDVATEIAGTTTPNLRLESAAPEIIAVEDGALVARTAGVAAVLISTDDGSIVDFVHVWAAPVTKVTLSRRDGERVSGAIALVVGEDVALVPVLWNGAQRLSGTGAVAWTTTGAEATGPVALLHDGSADGRRLYARTPGTASVTVALGDVKATVDVEVVPAAATAMGRGTAHGVGR